MSRENWAELVYSARGYDSAVSCSKMSRDAKSSLEKFAAAPRECACLQDGGRSRQ